MKRLLVLLAACNPAPSQPLPGGTVTPRPAARPSVRARDVAQACGYDVALDGHSAPDIRYRYALDDLGRVVHVTGTYAAGPDDSIDYTYDHLGHVTHMTESRTYGGQHGEITQRYDTLGDLISYSYAFATDVRQYTYSGFTDDGQPTHQETTLPDQAPIEYTFDYDAAGRIVVITGTDATTTIYTYDDDARTMTVDTNSGQYKGILTYDDRNHELDETWDGTGEYVYASDNRYEYDGDRMLSATYRSGTQAAPHELQLFEVDTLRYDCAPR